MTSLTPGQTVVKIVRDELAALMGGTESRLVLSGRTPNVIMLVGLQGSGKTTAAAKLANLLRKQGRRPQLVACDVYRPAAIEQLETLGRELDVPVYRGEGTDAVAHRRARACGRARRRMRDVVIVDTAGRLHVDEEMMAEAAAIRDAVRPDQVLMVVDAMTGQDAVNVAKAFAERVDFDGVIVTQARRRRARRRGAVGQGRHRQADQVRSRGREARRARGLPPRPHGRAHPRHGRRRSRSSRRRRSTSRRSRPSELEERLREGEFTLDDFLAQMQQLQEDGQHGEHPRHDPGREPRRDQGREDRREGARPRRRDHPVDDARRSARSPRSSTARAASASRGARASTVFDVNQLLKQFAEMKKMMKQFTNSRARAASASAASGCRAGASPAAASRAAASGRRARARRVPPRARAGVRAHHPARTAERLRLQPGRDAAAPSRRAPGRRGRGLRRHGPHPARGARRVRRGRGAAGAQARDSSRSACASCCTPGWASWRVPAEDGERPPRRPDAAASRDARSRVLAAQPARRPRHRRRAGAELARVRRAPRASPSPGRASASRGRGSSAWRSRGGCSNPSRGCAAMLGRVSAVAMWAVGRLPGVDGGRGTARGTMTVAASGML